MSRPAPIQIDTNTWIIMREHPTHPKGIVQRVIDTSGEARYLLMVWNVEPAKRRLHGIYTGLADADREVLWDNTEALRAAREAVPEFQGYPNMKDMPERGPIKLAQSAPDRHP